MNKQSVRMHNQGKIQRVLEIIGSSHECGNWLIVWIYLSDFSSVFLDCVNLHLFDFSSVFLAGTSKAFVKYFIGIFFFRSIMYDFYVYLSDVNNLCLIVFLCLVYFILVVTISINLIVFISLQLIVRASLDTGLSVQTADSVVTITVIRNLNPPLFNSSNYMTTIWDTTEIGASVLTVFATDADNVRFFSTPYTCWGFFVSRIKCDFLYPAHVIISLAVITFL